MNVSPLRSRRARILLSTAVASAAVAAGAPAAAAAAGDVTGGGLTWTSANVYVSGGARTWLGYVTQLAAGTATASGQAAGAPVTPASPAGETALDSFTFPVAARDGGTYDSTARTGTINTSGTVTFASSQYGFSISVSDPVIKLDGTTGTLSASGTGAAAPYTADQPLFNLDLSQATVKETAVGTQTIENIVPSLAAVGTAFPPNYQVGAGPDRTPNTFGTFSLDVRSGIEGRIASQRKGKVVITSAGLSALSARTYSVRLLGATGGKALATGRIVGGKRVVLTLAKGVKKLRKGEYRIKAAASLPPIVITLN